MATVTSGSGSSNATSTSVRILRWTFRRGEHTVVCELGLNRDNSAYELRVNPPWNPVGLTTERFDDAMSAFHRQAAIERILVSNGWTLEAFESDQVHTTPSSSHVPR
jgi:hypothetical protein